MAGLFLFYSHKTCIREYHGNRMHIFHHQHQPPKKKQTWSRHVGIYGSDWEHLHPKPPCLFPIEDPLWGRPIH